jgi:hypothetical protein
VAAPALGEGRCASSAKEKTKTVGQGSISFLKKRNKKLLLARPTSRVAGSLRRAWSRSKSFLVLFFKKEPLPWSSSFTKAKYHCINHLGGKLFL